jgi:hypothetical protein
MPFSKLLLGIPLLPLGGAILNGLLGRRLSRRVVALIACGMTAASRAGAISIQKPGYSDLQTGVAF